MKKKRELTVPILLGIIGAIVLTVLTGTVLTLAYLKDNDQLDNIMTVGEVVIEIDEDFVPPTDTPDPGEAVAKTVKIKNTGNIICTVRVRLLFEDPLFRDLAEPFETGSDWLYQPDGFYYYMKPVAPGEETQALINEVRFRTEYSDGAPVDSGDLEKIASGIIVYSESLEYIGGSDASGALPGENEILGNWEGY